MSNPDTDPHTFEASPSVAREISQAKLIVQNGVGYDDWITGIENAAPDPSRKVINVQHLLGLPDTTPNPHLWYKPATMPAVARAVAGDLAAIQPAHAAYFKATRPGSPPASPSGTRPSPSSRPGTRTPRWRPPNRWPTTCCRPRARTT